MGRRAGRVAATVVVTSALAVVINLATDWKTNPWAWLLVVAVTVLAGVVTLRLEDHPEPDLGRVADLLAIAVSDQWHYEAKLRYLDDPYAISVRWDPSDPALVEDWSSLVKRATSSPGWPPPQIGTWAPDPAGLTGKDNDIADVLGRVPTGRLIVLGEPGAGKTILLVRLVLDLLSRRRPGEVVPLLLSLASWNPGEQDLRSWIVQSLITGNSALALPAPDGMGVSRAQALVDSGLILPVLDGLDEIPDGVRGSAIARINNSMRPGEPLILAAREDEYGAAVCSPRGVEVPLIGAAGITLCPLDISVVSDYLKDSARGVTAAARWDEVLSSFTVDSPPPVAQALSTPLMVALARVIYNPRYAEETVAAIPEPTELLDPERFRTPKDVEEYLFDIFVRAAYREHPDPKRRCKWTAAQAEQWMVFLAHDLEHRQSGTTDLSWWRLSGAAPRPLAGIGVGLVAGIAGALGTPFPMDLGFGLVISASLAALLARKWLPLGSTDPKKGLAGGLFGGLLGALAAVAAFGAGPGNTFVGSFLALGLALSLVVAPWGRFRSGLAGAFIGVFLAEFFHHAHIVHEIAATTGLMARLMNGFGFGFVIGLAVGLSGRDAPARGLRWSLIGFLCGVASGLVIGFVVWIQVGSPGGLIVALASMIGAGYAGGFLDAAPTDLGKATSPRAVLIRDRATFRSSWLGFGLALGLGSGLAMTFTPNPIDGAPFGFRVGLGIGLANLIAVGLCFGFLQASWGSFTLARWWLAASGRLPWQLMTFLADAHENRGVLRQVGASYQFRHTELQRRLSSR